MAMIRTLNDFEEFELVLDQTPSMTRLNIRDIRPDFETRDRFLQVRIKSVGGLVKHIRCPFSYRKVVVEDETGQHMHLVVTVNNVDEEFASHLQFLKDESLKVNHLLVVTGMKIELDPLFPACDSSYIYHAVVNLSSADCKFIVILSTVGDNSVKVKKQIQKPSSANPKDKQFQKPNSTSPKDKQIQKPSATSPKDKTHQKNQPDEPYIYKKLNEIVACDKINVFGVVKFVKIPSKTRGDDYSTLITIVDQTPGGRLKCLLFGEVSVLPPVKPGQIIRFHRLQIKTFRDELQGQKGPGFSWVIFDGSPDAPLTLIASSHANSTITDKDQETVKRLRDWAASDETALSQEISSNSNTCLLCFADVTIGQYFNLVCQVVGMCVITEGESMLLKVWDGTQTKLRLHKQDMSAELSQKLQLDRGLAARVRPYLVDICVFDDHFRKASRIKPGDFVKFKNLHALKHKPLPGEEVNPEGPSAEICLHHGSSYGRGLVVLDHASPEADELSQRLSRAIADISTSSDSLEDISMNAKSGQRTNASSDRAVKPAPQRQKDREDARVSVSEEREEFLTPMSASQFQNSQLQTRCAETSTGRNRHSVGGVLNAPREKADSRSSDKLPTKHQRTDNSSMSENKVSSSMKLKDDALVANDRVCVLQPAEERPSVPRPLVGFATERCMLNTATVMTGHHHIKATTVADIKKHTPPYKFRFQGYAINYQPKSENASDFLKLYCDECQFLSHIPSSDVSDKPDSQESASSQGIPISKGVRDKVKVYGCPNCKGDLKYIFMLEFILHDGTGWIYVGLWRKNAVEFFGCTPTEMLRNPSRYEDIRNKLNIMCFGKPTVDVPHDLNALDGSKFEGSQVECCLMSYRTPCGVAYQIFDTVLSVES